ncbi:hypothetical protein STAN_4782 [Streptomyces sp. CBMAI 2042]|nr:hypothetical protein STAN_4782 [Streptomyces sp. CBMAI 2042]
MASSASMSFSAAMTLNSRDAFSSCSPRLPRSDQGVWRRAREVSPAPGRRSSISWNESPYFLSQEAYVLTRSAHIWEIFSFRRPTRLLRNTVSTTARSPSLSNLLRAAVSEKPFSRFRILTRISRRAFSKSFRAVSSSVLVPGSALQPSGPNSSYWASRSAFLARSFSSSAANPGRRAVTTGCR